jgi:hypothetical protein
MLQSRDAANSEATGSASSGCGESSSTERSRLRSHKRASDVSESSRRDPGRRPGVCAGDHLGAAAVTAARRLSRPAQGSRPLVTVVTSPVTAFTAPVTAITVTESGQRARIPRRAGRTKTISDQDDSKPACYLSSARAMLKIAVLLHTSCKHTLSFSSQRQCSGSRNESGSQGIGSCISCSQGTSGCFVGTDPHAAGVRVGGTAYSASRHSDNATFLSAVASGPRDSLESE